MVHWHSRGWHAAHVQQGLQLPTTLKGPRSLLGLLLQLHCQLDQYARPEFTNLLLVSLLLLVLPATVAAVQQHTHVCSCCVVIKMFKNTSCACTVCTLSVVQALNAKCCLQACY